MTALRTAAQQALDALENHPYEDRHFRETCEPAIIALRAALAEPEEPCPTCIALARTVMMDQVGQA